MGVNFMKTIVMIFMKCLKGVFYWFFWGIFRLVFLIYVPIKVVGYKNIGCGSFIFASNHNSYIDPIVVPLAGVRRMCFLARSTLFRNVLFGLWMKMGGAIPIKRGKADASTFKVLLKVLKKFSLVMFPEGTRYVEERKKKIQAGVGFLAVKSGVPVIPVYLDGTDKVLGVKSKFIKRAKVIVVFGQPVVYTEEDGSYQDVADKIYDDIYELKANLGKTGIEK